MGSKPMSNTTHKIEVYIPSVDGNGFQIDKTLRNSTVDAIAARLSGIGGGCTIVRGIGYYLNSVNILVAENVDIAYTFCSNGDIVRSKLSELRMLCEQIAYNWSQESVLIVIDNKPEFLKASTYCTVKAIR